MSVSSSRSKRSPAAERARRGGPGPAARRRPSLASRRLSAYILRSLSGRWITYQRELRACRERFAEESVHDLRVAIRRLVSTLDVTAAVVRHAGLRRMRRQLRRLLGGFGPLRDVQVQLLRVEEMLPRHPGLSVVRTVLLVQEQRLVRSLQKRIAAVQTAEHAGVVRELRGRIDQAFRDSSRARARRGAVVATATAAFANAVRLKEMADRSRPATIHRLRVAFKKFRYRAEMLQPLIPGLSKEMLPAMNRYQTRMGEIQDVEVFLGLLRRHLRRTRAGGLRPAVLELLALRRELLRAFFASASELYALWPVSVQDPHAVFAAMRRR